MTIFILNGSIQDTEGYNTLLVPFALDQEERAQLYIDTMASDLVVALPGLFIQQVEWADAIFFCGGDAFRLVNWLRQIGNEWIQLAANKLIVGVSAGVSALTTVSFNTDRLCLLHGMGLLNYKSIVHWDSSLLSGWTQLRQSPPDLPILLLPDNLRIVMEDDKILEVTTCSP